MANLNERTVEEQIQDSELVNRLRERFCEDGAAAGLAFVSMERDEQDRVVLSMTLSQLLNIPLPITSVINALLDSIAKECPVEMEALTKLLVGAAIKNKNKILGLDDGNADDDNDDEI